MGRSLSAPSVVTPSRMTSNGFVRRKIITTAGAYSFALPSDVTECDIAIFGAGGGGSLRMVGGSIPSAANPGGGGGGGFSRRRFRNISGGTVTGTVGARGLGGNLPNANASGSSAGQNGGTTTAIFGGLTLSATGGSGATIDSQPQTANRAAGGVGSGGDINANGGRGGWASGYIPNGQTFSPTPASCGPGGGGASGSHLGNGGDGGDGITLNSSGGGTYYPSGGGGGGWGGKGANALQSSQYQTATAFGGTSKGQGGRTTNQGWRSFFLAPVDCDFVQVAQDNGSAAEAYFSPRQRDWWDIEDGGRAWPSGYAFTSQGEGIVPIIGGLGSGGTSRYSLYPSPAGFGGGGAGRQGYGNTQPLQLNENLLDFGAPNFAGVGGGGGGVVSSYVSTPYDTSTPVSGTVYGMAGGPGCVIIWY